MRKRILCMLMALCMIASLLPFTAAAAEIVDSGTCGDNVTWTLDSDGLLTISGTGKMTDYSWSGSPFYYSHKIKTVIIESGVTSIGSCAFCYCKNITSIVIPDGITSIGDSAFSSCSSLESISIPNSVTSIGDNSFGDCAALKNIVIPDGLPSIGRSTFSGCAALTDMVIPDSVASIGSFAFSDCTALENISIHDGTSQIGVEAFRNCTSLTNIVLPDSIANIETGAFLGCTALTDIHLPNSITYIAIETFKNCTSLKSVSLPVNLRGINARAFENCSTLVSVNGTDELNWIGDDVFINCVSLKEVRNFDNAFISSSCFQGCSQLKIITAGNISEENIFQGCTALEQVTTYRTKELEAYVFGNCPSLKEVYVSKTLETVKANAFRGATGLTDVYYEGTQEDWNKIQISKTGNDPLLNARIHFNWNVISESPFDDVREWDGAYYNKPVLWALRHQPQITNGTSDTTFSPEATCTRGQVVTFLWRAMGQPEPKSTTNPFTDVPSNEYYYKAVLWAVEKGITNGTSPTTFSPNAPCTRAHVVTFLWRAEGQPAAGSSNPFSDVPAGQYYTSAVLWAVSKNITNGTSANTFSPDSPCTRGQIVTFLYRDMK